MTAPTTSILGTGSTLATPHDPKPEVQFRTIHGYRRAFIKEGTGPALLLIHGIGDDSSTWSEVIPELSKTHTVIAPDLLGHGQSDKPRADYSLAAYANAMRDLLSVLDIERATLIGHSLGGGVAMQLAYQYPELCDRLVLVATGGVSRDVNPLLRLAAAAPVEFVFPVLRLRGARSAGHFIAAAVTRFYPHLARDVTEWLRVFDTLADNTSHRAFVRALRAVVDGQGQVVTMLDRAYLAAETPILIVWGERDPVLPFEHGQIAHGALPGSRLEILPDTGHFPHRSESTRFVDLVREFLETTTSSPYDAARFRALLRRGRIQLEATDPCALLSPAL